jgi:hypothetical protein
MARAWFMKFRRIESPNDGLGSGRVPHVKRACMAAENVDVAAGHSKMLAVLVLVARERPWRVRQVRASVVEKLRAAWVR